MRKLTITLTLVACFLTGKAQEPTDSVAYSEENITTLQDFTITAKKELIKVDAEKMTYEAQEDPDAQSLSALDLLRRVPMVTVDGQDNITVNGRSDFQIYVDGKPNPMLSANPGQLLRAFPASTIARIEVINNPGARYDAEGVGGILNIVLKSAGSMNGYTATITGVGGDKNQSGSLYAMAQQDKVGATVNLSGMHYKMSDFRMVSDREDTSTGFLLHNNSRMNQSVTSLNASAHIDWKPNDRNTFSVTGSFQRTPITARTSSSVSMQQSQDEGAYGYQLSNTTRMRITGVNAGADYTHIFGSNENHKLQLSYRFNLNPTRVSGDNIFSPLNDGPGEYLPEDYFTLNKASMTENVGQADYTLPVGEKNTFTAGTKLTFRRSSSEAEELDFVHHSNITAAYLNYALKAGDFSLSAGARYEHTHQSARYMTDQLQSFKADYNNFVPSLTMSYSFAPVRTLSFGYNMRISRPGINMLNPYVNDTDPLQVKYGNPDLKPEKYNNLNLTWSAMWGKVMLNAQGSYSISNDGITQYTKMQDGITYTTFYNELRSRQATAMIYLIYSPFPATRITLSSSTSYSALRSNLFGLSSHGWSENYMAGVQQTLPWALNLSVNVFGQTGGRALQMTTGHVFTHMLSLSRSFLSDRLNVSVTAMSPFCAHNTIKIHEWGQGMDNHTSININMRSFMVSVSYRIGDLKRPQPKAREIDSDLVNPSQQSGNIPGNLPGTSF